MELSRLEMIHVHEQHYLSKLLETVHGCLVAGGVLIWAGHSHLTVGRFLHIVSLPLFFFQGHSSLSGWTTHRRKDFVCGSVGKNGVVLSSANLKNYTIIQSGCCLTAAIVLLAPDVGILQLIVFRFLDCWILALGQFV